MESRYGGGTTSPRSVAPRRWARWRCRMASGARSSCRASPVSYGRMPMLDGAPRIEIRFIRLLASSNDDHRIVTGGQDTRMLRLLLIVLVIFALLFVARVVRGTPRKR